MRKRKNSGQRAVSEERENDLGMCVELLVQSMRSIFALGKQERSFLCLCVELKEELLGIAPEEMFLARPHIGFKDTILENHIQVKNI